MLPQSYADSLPLAERLYRQDPKLAAKIYSNDVLRFLKDGVIIFPGVMNLATIDSFNHDLESLARNKTDPLFSRVEVDGPKKYYEARFLSNLDISDFRAEPPGLKLLDLQRFFNSAKALSFAEPIMGFLEELFGASPALIQSLTFWKGSEQSVHQDFSYVHHHRRTGELAAAWIPLEDIQPDAGPLIYYKGSHFPDRLGFSIGEIDQSLQAAMREMGFSMAIATICSVSWKPMILSQVFFSLSVEICSSGMGPSSMEAWR